MKSSTFVTLGQASKQWNVSKSKISNDLKNGKLSYISKDQTGYQIDPSELDRVYSQKQYENTNKERSENTQNTLENIDLKHQIELLNKDLEHSRALEQKAQSDCEKWEKETEHWRQQATNLLTDQSKKADISLIQGVKNFLGITNTKEN